MLIAAFARGGVVGAATEDGKGSEAREVTEEEAKPPPPPSEAYDATEEAREGGAGAASDAREADATER